LSHEIVTDCLLSIEEESQLRVLAPSPVGGSTSTITTSGEAPRSSDSAQSSRGLSPSPSMVIVSVFTGRPVGGTTLPTTESSELGNCNGVRYVSALAYVTNNAPWGGRLCWESGHGPPPPTLNRRQGHRHRPRARPCRHS